MDTMSGVCLEMCLHLVHNPNKHMVAWNTLAKVKVPPLIPCYYSQDCRIESDTLDPK